MKPARVVALAALVVVASGCGLPDHEVQRLDPATVPFGLLVTSPPSPSPQARGPVTDIYLVSNQRLRVVRRRVVGANVPAEAVRALLLGPSAAEAHTGLVSAVPSDTRLISLDVEHSVATVDLSAPFATVAGTQQVLAVAQIVFTLTGSAQITAVRFAIGGRVIDMPDATGSLSSVPRTRRDYRTLSPGG